jgi:hypothetical protein
MLRLWDGKGDNCGLGERRYDCGEISGKMVVCNDKLFWDFSSAMSFDQGEVATAYFKKYPGIRP